MSQTHRAPARKPKKHFVNIDSLLDLLSEDSEEQSDQPAPKDVPKRSLSDGVDEIKMAGLLLTLNDRID